MRKEFCDEPGSSCISGGLETSKASALGMGAVGVIGASAAISAAVSAVEVAV